MSFNDIDFKNFSSISSLYYIVLGDTEYPLKLSGNWAQLLGASLEEIYATPYLDLFHPEFLKQTCIHLMKVAQGKDQEFTTKLLTKEGARVVMVWSAHRGDDFNIYAVAQKVSVALASEKSKPVNFHRDSFIVKLTEMELKIYSYLEKHMNQLVKKEELANAIYGASLAPPQSLNVHIYNLRKKLERFPLTLKGIGKSGWMLVLDENGKV